MSEGKCYTYQFGAKFWQENKAQKYVERGNIRQYTPEMDILLRRKFVPKVGSG